MAADGSVRARVDVSELVRALAAKPEAMRRVVQQFVPLVGDTGRTIMIGDMQRKFKRPTGPLAGSVQWKIAAFGGRTQSVEIGPGAAGTPLHYAKYADRGNAPPGGDGYIYPKNGKFLTFMIHGRRVFAKRVRAFEGHHFVPYTRDELQRQAPEMLRDLIREEVDR